MKNSLIISLIAATYMLLFSCQGTNQQHTDSQTSQAVTGNPPAEGFDIENSDTQAIEIADAVMESMGGRAAWDNTRHIAWNFFDFRKLIWDKWTGDVRVETPGKDMITLMNIHSMEGKVKVGDEEYTHPDSLAKFLKIGKGAWINDSYWLVMPFKLKDSGVTLTYEGEGSTEDGRAADILGLSFKKVGFTPQNRYKIFVDKERKLVTQWSFYRNPEDTEPGFITPWIGYEKYGEILLGGDRGERENGAKREVTQISVNDTLSSSVYTSFEPVDWGSL